MRRKIDIDAHEQEVTRLYQNGTPTDTIKALLKGRGVTISDRTLRHRLEEWGLRTPRVRTCDNEALHQRVKELHDQRLPTHKIKETLASEGTPISDRTLSNLRRKLGIKLRTDDPAARKQQEDEIRVILLEEYRKGTIQGFGRKLLQQFLQNRGIFYPRDRIIKVYNELVPGGQGPIGLHPKESGRAGASAGGYNAKAALKIIRAEKKAARDAARATAAASGLVPSTTTPIPTSNITKKPALSRINRANPRPDSSIGQDSTSIPQSPVRPSSRTCAFDFNNTPIAMPQNLGYGPGNGMVNHPSVNPQPSGRHDLAARRAWLEAELQRVEMEEAQLSGSGPLGMQGYQL